MDFGEHIRELGVVPEFLLEGMQVRLAALLEKQPELWEAHDAIKPNAKMQVFQGQSPTQHIVMSFPESLKSHRGAKLFDSWEEWKDVIQPIIDHVVPWYGYQDGRCTRIMLARLRAGGTIGRHVDNDEASRVPHKIHVPLVTRPEVEFWVGDGSYNLKRGFSYEVNNRVVHGGANRSNVDRIHLIFDYFEAKPS